MNASIQEDLSLEEVQKLNIYLDGLPIEKLEDLMEQLMECILFLLNCGENDVSFYQLGYTYHILYTFMFRFIPLSCTKYDYIKKTYR